MICSFGFDTLGLHRISADVVDGNDRSARVLEKAGFRLEGRRRDDARVARQWADILEFGLLSEEWSARHRTIDSLKKT
jgi:ribosomal-protein-alanine N-acetyltransferase